MALQIRVAATCRLVNRCTGSTPGRLFQISTSRAPGHLAASLSSSCGLLNVSLPFSLAFICGEEPETLMLLSVSIVNAVISSFLSSHSSMTFIPLVGGTSKRIRFQRKQNQRSYK
jgi:hypothetical protein